MTIPELTGRDFLPVLPALVLTAGAILLLLSEVFLTGGSRTHQPVIGAVSAVLAGYLSFKNVLEPGGYVFLKFGVVDPFSSALTVILCVGLFLALLLTSGFLRHRNAERGEFYALMLFGVAGMSLLAISAELITLFVNLEILSLATYALTTFLRRGPRPAEAGFKYFILGAFSSAVLLYGAALLYGVTGSTLLSDMKEPLAVAFGDPEKSSLAYVGVALIAMGFAFKIAAVPFHMWTPDVYEGAPTPVTALMSAGVKTAAFASLVRVFLVFMPNVSPRLPVLLFGGLAVLTMLVGNLLAIPQRNVKRMLAYSSIAHAGYLLLGVTALFAKPGGEGLFSAGPLLGAGAPDALQSDAFKGILFYLLGYTVTTLGSFGTLSALERREDEDKGNAWDLERFAGLAQRKPGWAFAMAACLLSLGGIPPTVGFMGKLLIFRSAVDAGLVWLAVVGILTSAAAIYYYLRVVVYMFMRPAPENAPSPVRFWATELALVLSTIAVIGMGVMPGPVSTWLSQASSIFGS
ncbi:MAG: NADH-quinone oxidoreductase subunit N [Myxococcaceae bacterium]